MDLNFLRRKRNTAKFTKVFIENLFGGIDSRSGRGSDMDQTVILRQNLRRFLLDLGDVSTLLDLPCGDLKWISRIDLSPIKYSGADIVPEMIYSFSTNTEFSDREFFVIDITKEKIGRYDVILSRDLLVHLSTSSIKSTIQNFKSSGSKFLVTTHFTNTHEYRDIDESIPIDWRPINFTLPPFSFPNPIAILVEGCTEAEGAYSDKTLAVWKLSAISI